MRLPLILAASTAAAAVLLVGNDEFPSHAECALFTEKGASMRRQASLDGTRAGYRQSNLTVQVTGLLAGPNRIIPGGSRWELTLGNGMKATLRQDAAGESHTTFSEGERELGTRPTWLERKDDATKSLVVWVRRQGKESEER